MERAASLASGKGHRDENFPVASILIDKRRRPAILAFYRFARTADDVADHPCATPAEKLHLLENMWRTLHGEADLSPEAVALRSVLAEEQLSPQYALQLLEAFRRDVTKLRYADWDELMDYCRYSAMPVGRFVLEVHRESRAMWPACDALCAALQIINHLQDCGPDYRNLDRVYIPLDVLDAHSLEVAALGDPRASQALRLAIADVARRNEMLLEQSRLFAAQIANRRLALEVSVIQRLAESLNRRLLARDPLSERVHHRTIEAVGLALLATVEFLSAGRRKASASIAPQTHGTAHGDRS
ncbi:MAG TPA: squalene synthase HpnC [Rhizomicrobium sp.]|jgi:squalene synthase HpnC